MRRFIAFALVLACAASGNSALAQTVTWKGPEIRQDSVRAVLPAEIDDVCAGGGGRYLLLHYKRLSKIAVFDLSQVRIAGYIPVAQAEIRFAAGREKLFIANIEQKTLERWNLSTRERELVAPQPVDGIVRQLVLGCDAAGPLLMHLAEGNELTSRNVLSFVNTSNMRAQKVATDYTGWFRLSVTGEVIHIRANPPGDCFAAWTMGNTPSGGLSIRLAGDKADILFRDSGYGNLVPGIDGRAIFSGQGSVLSPELREIVAHSPGASLLVPSLQNRYYLDLPRSGEPRFGGFEHPTGLSSLYLLGERRVLATVPKFPDVPLSDASRSHSEFTVDKRVWFLPHAKLIVTIPAANDCLVLHRFDIDEVLEKTGRDYLFVESDPVITATRGVPYRYQMGFKSKRKVASCALDHGPEGMQVAATGLVTWKPAADLPVPKDVPVSIVVTDGTDQNVYHRFFIQVK